jgi:hypothetical protein
MSLNLREILMVILYILKRPWNPKFDRATLIDERKVWRTGKAKYIVHRGKLWSLKIKSLTPEVLRHVQGSQKDYIIF